MYMEQGPGVPFAPAAIGAADGGERTPMRMVGERTFFFNEEGVPSDFSYRIEIKKHHNLKCPNYSNPPGTLDHLQQAPRMRGGIHWRRTPVGKVWRLPYLD